MTAPNNVKTAVLAFTAAGDNTIIAAVAGSPIVVWKIAFTTHAAETIAFFDSASANLLALGSFEFTAAGSLVLDGPEGFPLFRTTIGNALIANLATGVAIKGIVWYSLA